MFIIRFNFFQSDSGCAGISKVRTELLYKTLPWDIKRFHICKFSEFNLPLEKEVEGSLLFWLNWYQPADSESTALRVCKEPCFSQSWAESETWLSPEGWEVGFLVLFFFFFKYIEILSYKALHGLTPSKCSIVRKNFKLPITVCLRIFLWFIGISFAKKSWAALHTLLLLVT